MTQELTPSQRRAQLERWFAAAVDAVEPEAATRRALERAGLPSGPPAILSFGKAAHGMARAAVRWLEAHQIYPTGGLVVSHQDPPAERMPIESLVGDHPVPGERSRAAANRLGEIISRLPEHTPVLVFLSGGSSSLLAAPLDGITDDELNAAFEVFHALGLGIHTMNALRRQLTRWSGGRLAGALGDRDVRAWLISDVVDNDVAVIGSGPLVGGEVSPGLLGRVLARPDLVARLPASVARALGEAPPRERTAIPHHLVADRMTAAEAAIRAAQGDGVTARLHDTPITGDANHAGEELTEWIAAHIRRHALPSHESGIFVIPRPRQPRLHVWTGETTVTLPEHHGHGGRAQQVALVVARGLARLERQGVNVHAISVLVAGTDGRDGPTDAAGAIVDRETAVKITANGIDIDHAIARCDAYPALEAAGALVRTGTTGTNVADLVMLSGWSWY